MHFLTAIAEVGANGDEQTLYEWGYKYSVEFLTSTYKSMLTPNDPLKSITKCVSLFHLHFDAGKIEAKIMGEKKVELHVTGFPRDFKYFYSFMRGWNARVFTLAGAQKVESEFKLKSWEGAPKTVIEYRFT